MDAQGGELDGLREFGDQLGFLSSLDLQCLDYDLSNE